MDEEWAEEGWLAREAWRGGQAEWCSRRDESLDSGREAVHGCLQVQALTPDFS